MERPQFVTSESMALDWAIAHMDVAEARTRERFMYFLQHKYFPAGHFIPEVPGRMTIDRPQPEMRGEDVARPDAGMAAKPNKHAVPPRSPAPDPIEPPQESSKQ